MQNGHPLAFLSKALGPNNQGLSTYKKEYMAILIAITQWRSYLQLAEFHIYTDHQSLAQLNERSLHIVWQQKVYLKLVGLQYKNIYKRVCDNAGADALSRYPHQFSHLLHASQCKPTWVQQVIQGYQHDPQTQEILTQLAIDSADSTSHFTLKDGLIRQKGRIWLGNNISLQTSVILAFHKSTLGGHSATQVCQLLIEGSSNYLRGNWKGTKQSVHNFVQSYAIYSQAKPSRSKYLGLLLPLVVQPHVWNSVSMDFIEDLPKSGTMDCILVVVDRFSKYSQFLALPHPFSAAKVAKLFLDNIYRLHGMPTSILSDKDHIF